MLLLRTLRHLPSKDLRSIRQWVRCELFNKREDVMLLCDYLVDHIGKAKDRDLSPEAMWKAACPGKPFDEKQMRHLASFLLEEIRQYLAWSEWRNHPADSQPMLLRALRNRNLDFLFEKELDSATQSLQEHPIRDARYHYSKYLLLQEEVEYTSGNDRSAKLNLQPLPDELTVFYLSEMLRHACLARVHQSVAGQAYKIELMEVILSNAGKKTMLQVPAIAVYYHAYRMLEAPQEDEALEQLKQALFEHETRFPPEEMRVLYLMAINGCIRRMNAGRKSYVREAFELYNVALERNFLKENGRLSGFTYKNILRVAAGMGAYEWAEQFLETQKAALHPRERENLYRYNLAYLYFKRQDFAQAMPLLQQVELDDVLNNLDARRMLLQTYYQLKEWEALESLFQSFGAYLRRQKNLDYHRTTNENLIHYAKRLVEIDRRDKLALLALRNEINSRNDIAEKGWLLECID
ncbi:MAG: hypothetical protein JNJ57_17820 [Saprospiraceae bacterium]|nr:hypothetical protein [Saprospiraceae bacterium]